MQGFQASRLSFEGRAPRPASSSTGVLPYWEHPRSLAAVKPLGHPHLSHMARGKCSLPVPFCCQAAQLAHNFSCRVVPSSDHHSFLLVSKVGLATQLVSLEKIGRMTLLLCSHRQALILHWGCCCLSHRAHLSPLLCDRKELSPWSPFFPNYASSTHLVTW